MTPNCPPKWQRNGSGLFRAVGAGLVVLAFAGSIEAQGDDRAALRALQGLRAVVRGGLTFREYSTRLNDARIAAEPFISSSRGSSDAKTSIAKGLMFYGAAANLWSYKIKTGQDYTNAELLKALRAIPCGHLGKLDPGIVRMDEAINAAWLCAGAEVARAETLLAK